MQIGFIGLGHMGQAIASNLLNAGHSLAVYNRTREKSEALARQGAEVADTPAAAAAASEALFTMLGDDEAVEAMTFGKDGALSALGRDKIHISLSTISVALADRLEAAHREAGQLFVAAPVLGRPEAAAARELFVIAAGPKQAIERVQPLLDAIGKRTFLLGERPSAASLAKIATNFLIAATLESLGEAFALVRKSDIDPQRYLEILTSTLFAAPVYKTYGAMIVAEKYEPAGFAMPMGLKDIGLALEAGRATRVPMPVASVVRDHYLAGLAAGLENAEWAAIAQVCARDAGLTERRGSDGKRP